MLEAFAEDLWIATRPLRFFGLELGTRMSVVRLPGGGLFVHSPVALDAATREAVDALGPVVAIVAPCLFHHLYVGEWAAAYPTASVSACPGLQEKRKDIAWSRVLGDEPAEEWRGALDQVFFGALPMQNEIVFHHRASKTIVSSDLIANLSAHPSGTTRAVGWLIGNRKPAPTIVERVMIKDRARGREEIQRIVDWKAERLVLAHGGVVEAAASTVVQDGYAWL